VPTQNQQIKLKATIHIEIDATDYREAAKLETEIGDLTRNLAEKYGDVTYKIRERRDRTRPNRRDAPHGNRPAPFD
jgi:hypothetical protein